MIRTIRTAVWSLIAVAMCPVALYGADSTSPAMETTVVQGKSLKDLRKDLKKAEDRFRSLYNELNQDSSQRVECREEASTGSRFTKRTCGTAAMNETTAEQVRQSLAEMSFNAGVDQPGSGAPGIGSGPVATGAAASRVGGEPTTGGAVNLGAERDAFQKNIEKLLTEHPELRQRLRDYVQARQRLDAAEGRSAAKPEG